MPSCAEQVQKKKKKKKKKKPKHMHIRHSKQQVST